MSRRSVDGCDCATADAKYWIPTENEWYKAAYHKNDGVTGNYFDYPTEQRQRAEQRV